MDEASRQDGASSYGHDDVEGSEQGHVLSFESEDDLEFEEEYHDKIYNRSISHLVVACIGLFRRQMSQKTSSASDKPETTTESREKLAEFIVHMNDTSECWMAETDDLAENMIHGLDSLFNEYKDRKVMVVDVFEVLIEALQYEEIREASRRNDDLSLDIAFPFDDTASVKVICFPLSGKCSPMPGVRSANNSPYLLRFVEDAYRTTPSFLSCHPEIWELHVNRDVKPFVCLSEQCRSPVLFFASMERWIEHMNKMHSHEWTRKIHPASWICDTNHDAIQFKDVESFREHMNDTDSHPTTPNDHELRVLEIEQWRYLPRNEHLCPLCDFTLDMPKRSISTDVTEANLYRPLHEHIASHLKDLTVLSLPILDTTKGSEMNNATA
ncbi:hypothetical protein MKX08_007139 [Trichoderma sp. CBMAI-0020]|nr:hypothetical protein MKX08_007139 [Trichoderma sp. CBMAI-0020]WOD46606.1 hypothetical protein [Trichoderma atroviride]